MFVDLGKAEALLPLSEQVPRENFRINDRLLGFVLDVRKTNKGPQIVLSRAAEGLVQRLLGARGSRDRRRHRRDHGESRASRAVARRSPSRRIARTSMPLGRASVRNRAASPASPKNCAVRRSTSSAGPSDAVGFIHNALAPAKVLGVELFDDEGVGLVTVPDYQLSLAIGREGQNVRLAARLTGWRLDITSEADAEEARARYIAEREERAAVERRRRGRSCRRETARGPRTVRQSIRN